MTVQSTAGGIKIDLQITGINESYIGHSKSISPLFGNRQKNILDEIRKIGVVR